MKHVNLLLLLLQSNRKQAVYKLHVAKSNIPLESHIHSKNFYEFIKFRRSTIYDF